MSHSKGRVLFAFLAVGLMLSAGHVASSAGSPFEATAPAIVTMGEPFQVTATTVVPIVDIVSFVLVEPGRGFSFGAEAEGQFLFTDTLTAPSSVGKYPPYYNPPAGTWILRVYFLTDPQRRNPHYPFQVLKVAKPIVIHQIEIPIQVNP